MKFSIAALLLLTSLSTLADSRLHVDCSIELKAKKSKGLGMPKEPKAESIYEVIGDVKWYFFQFGSSKSKDMNVLSQNYKGEQITYRKIYSLSIPLDDHSSCKAIAKLYANDKENDQYGVEYKMILNQGSIRH